MPNKIITKKGQRFGCWEVLEPNVINPDTTSIHYKNKAVFSKCICKECNITIRYIRNNELKKYSTKPCIRCKNRATAEKVHPKIGDKFGLLTVIGDGGYDNERHYSICQCECGNTITIMDNNLKTGNTSSCGCLTSKGENIIEKLLKTNNFIYNHDIIYQPFLQDTGLKYRFDFIIYNNDGSINRFIEFDGRQHTYGPDTNYWGHTTDTLETIKKRDNIKNTWCLNNNYTLIRIPYTKINNITLNDLFSDKYQVKG